jgi:hypothetical protein
LVVLVVRPQSVVPVALVEYRVQEVPHTPEDSLEQMEQRQVLVEVLLKTHHTQREM